MGARVLAALWAFWLVGCCGWVQAHPMPESRVWIDTTPAGLRLTLQLPLNRLEYGFGQPLADDPGAVLPQHAEALAAYLAAHVGARSGDRAWHSLAPQLSVEGNDASAELQAVIELVAPAGADSRSPTLQYDAITHEVRTHRAQVFLRTDWAGGFAGQVPLLLGQLDTQHTRLPLALQAPRTGASVWNLVKAGALHIAEGTDHLLFLLLLVVVSPLVAKAGRWHEVRPAGEAVRQLAWVVTAFTLGHSLTLALASLGVVRLPAQAVEVAVALSIVVAAVHALRPLMTQGERLMALGFGLVHGFAFSDSLSGAGLSAGQLAQAVLAFNLGIEMMQLLILLAVAPALLLLSRSSPAGYAHLRRAVAVVAGALAGLWMAQRLGWHGLGPTEWAEDAGRTLPVIIGLPWVVVLGYRARGMGSRAPRPGE